MRHRVDGRTFGRRPEQRKALLRGLANSLLDAERIVTTLEKAKELRRVVEPLVTLAKKGNLFSRRRAGSYLYRRETLTKLFGEIAERFRDRKGGYTRIYRLGRRIGDGAQKAIIELLRDKTASKEKGEKGSKETKPKKKPQRRATKTQSKKDTNGGKKSKAKAEE